MSSTDTLNTVIPRLTAIVSGHKDFLNKMKQQDNNRKSLQNSAENALRPAATEKNERERESTFVKSSKMRWSAAIATALWSSCCVNVSSFFPNKMKLRMGCCGMVLGETYAHQDALQNEPWHWQVVCLPTARDCWHHRWWCRWREQGGVWEGWWPRSRRRCVNSASVVVRSVQDCKKHWWHGNATVSLTISSLLQRLWLSSKCLP